MVQIEKIYHLAIQIPYSKNSNALNKLTKTSIIIQILWMCTLFGLEMNTAEKE